MGNPSKGCSPDLPSTSIDFFAAIRRFGVWVSRLGRVFCLILKQVSLAGGWKTCLKMGILPQLVVKITQVYWYHLVSFRFSSALFGVWKRVPFNFIIFATIFRTLWFSLTWLSNLPGCVSTSSLQRRAQEIHVSLAIPLQLLQRSCCNFEVMMGHPGMKRLFERFPGKKIIYPSLPNTSWGSVF